MITIKSLFDISEWYVPDVDTAWVEIRNVLDPFWEKGDHLVVIPDDEDETRIFIGLFNKYNTPTKFKYELRFTKAVEDRYGE